MKVLEAPLRLISSTLLGLELLHFLEKKEHLCYMFSNCQFKTWLIEGLSA
jgi:hypothetical protein